MEGGYSLYIHIPFCRRRCFYCDFYSTVYQREKASSYIEVISSQLKQIETRPRTIYIGGGTPSVLDKNLLKKLLLPLLRFSKTEETTIEVNPESLTKEKLSLLKECGINRLSIGVQSFNNRILKSLGRIHTAYAAKKAIEKAAQAGFSNISIDLIFGIHSQTLNDFSRDLKNIPHFPLTHVSCYCLSYEKGTLLYRWLQKKEIQPLPEKKSVQMYKYALDYLRENKFLRYEVSNFAKKGFICKHNLSYWENTDYLGLGAAAVSFRKLKRTKNVSSIDKYIKLFREGKPLYNFTEELPPEKYAQETAALGIRQSKGINFAAFRKKTGFDFVKLEKDALRNPNLKPLFRYKKAKGAIYGIKLTQKGFLFADELSSAFL